jgi:hypothetical protein
MALADITLINGISIMAIAIVAALIGVWFLLRYFREKKKLLPFVSILGFCWVAQYLGPLATFWSLVFTGHNIAPELYLQLSYTISPVAIINSVWLAFSIFNPKWRKLAVLIFVASAVPYYIALFGMTSTMYEANAPNAYLDANGLPLDTSLQSLLLLVNFAYIITAIFILGVGFFLLRKKVTGSEKQRATFMGFAYVLFGIAAILETYGEIGLYVLVLARIMMATYLVLVYLGFSSKAAKDATPPAASA